VRHQNATKKYNCNIAEMFHAISIISDQFGTGIEIEAIGFLFAKSIQKEGFLALS